MTVTGSDDMLTTRLIWSTRSPSWSEKLGYGMLWDRTNACAFPSLSRVLMPMNAAVESRPAASTSPWDSLRHGPHQEAQVFRTTTLPASSLRSPCPPPTRDPDRSGASLRSLALISWIDPSPETKLVPSVALFPEVVQLLAETARATAQSTVETRVMTIRRAGIQVLLRRRP